MKTDYFAHTLLRWFEQAGRHDLPWQHPRSAYRVWVSEIMLQQTQVTTVIPYFERFMVTFPDIATLAAAPLDEVLHLWTGLGYYARARNLHKAAMHIAEHYKAEFPQQFDDVVNLPGIGRSTAAAILAQAFGQRQPILDGNVKRVLSRIYAISGWTGHKRVEQRLWQLAEEYTPQQRITDYTQAIMDLGATLCTARRPNCGDCPFAADCQAHLANQVACYPTARPRKTKPVRATYMLLLQDTSGQVMLQQRPPSGIWGGLWSFPECPLETDIHHWCEQTLGLRIDTALQHHEKIRHSFSHFHLDIHPIVAQVHGRTTAIMEPSDTLWYNTIQPDALGLPTPVKQLLEQLA